MKKYYTYKYKVGHTYNNNYPYNEIIQDTLFEIISRNNNYLTIKISSVFENFKPYIIKRKIYHTYIHPFKNYKPWSNITVNSEYFIYKGFPQILYKINEVTNNKIITLSEKLQNY